MDLNGERYLPDLPAFEISYEHWHRYLYATGFSAGKTVLDIACGEGYGAALLAENAKQVVGVDINKEVIENAEAKYVRPNLQFLTGSVQHIPIKGKEKFDLIVSLETIEHVDEGTQIDFLREVKRLLRPNGVFIISTPDKLVYSDMEDYENKFHVKEFYAEEFSRFLLRYFAQVEILGQDIYTSSYIKPPARSGNIGIAQYNLSFDNGFKPQKKGDIHDRYMVAVCSETNLPALPPSLLFNDQNKRADYGPAYQVLYIDTGDGFNESQAIRKNKIGLSDHYRFDVSGYSGIKHLRFDPAACPVYLRINEIWIETLGGEKVRASYRSSSGIQEGDFWLFDSNDPQIFIDNPESNELKAIVFYIEYIAIGTETYPYLKRHTAAKFSLLSEKIAELTTDVENKEKEKAAISKELKEKAAHLSEQEEKLQVHQQLSAKLEAWLAEKNALTQELSQRMASAENSLKAKDEQLWQLTEQNNKSIESLKDLERELATARADARILEERLDRGKEQRSSLEKQVKEQREQLSRLAEQNSKSIESLKDLERELATARADARILEERLDRGKEQRSSLEKQVKEQQETLFEKERLLQAKKVKLKDALALQAKLAAEKARFQERLLELERKHADLIKACATLDDELQNSHKHIQSKDLEYSQLKDNMESEIHSLKDLLEHQTSENQQNASLLQIKENAIADLHMEIGRQAQFQKDIQSSVSYRLGFALTYPARRLYDLLTDVPFGQNKLWLVGRMIRTGLGSPRAFLTAFNAKNLKVFFRALRTEPSGHISKNFDDFLSRQAKANSKIQLPKLDKVLLTCDDAALFSGRLLLIRGWALSPFGMDKIEVWEGNRLLGEASYGGGRPDLEKAYPNVANSKLSGFYFEHDNGEVGGTMLTIKAIDKKGFKESVEVVPVVKIDHSQLSLDDQYQLFLAKNRLTEEQITQIKEECNHFQYQPLISIIVPVYNVDGKWLDKCINSVLVQYYENWELCLYDDASTKQETLSCLDKWKNTDQRIRIKLGQHNGNISVASNKAIAMTAGEYIGLLDNDDELEPHALYEVVKALNADRELDFIYSDEDKIDEQGRFVEPHFKSGFNPDMLCSQNYICHFAVVKKSVGERVGWFRKGYEGSQDHDLFLRIMDETEKIHHIPKVLYHWRKIGGSTASDYSEKNYVFIAGKRAIEDHLEREKTKGVVLKGAWPGTYRVSREITQHELVSIIVPFKDQVGLLKTCVDSILKKTVYKNYEILLISNNSQEKDTFSYLKKITKSHKNIRSYEYNVPFNFSKINNWAAKKAKGKYILLLNNDTEIINKGWLTAMVEHIQRPEVGAVGAKLLYHDDTVQHGGVIIGLGGVAGHSHKYHGDDDPGYFARLMIIQNLSACTAACLLLKKKVFEEVGGLDEKNLKVAFNDIDLCLKIREKNYLIVYTPYARLYHYESKSRGFEDTPEKQARFQSEVLFFQEKWKEFLEKKDEYYNPNLTLDRENFALNIV